MRKKLFGRHGSITIFLCMILSAIIVLESIFISGAYRRKREVILTEAVNHQAEQIMSQFNKDYLDWYGIYALDSIEAGSSVFETMTSGMEETSFQYELTDKLAAELVERVTISPDGEITVRLKYADVLAGLYKSCCTE